MLFMARPFLYTNYKVVNATTNQSCSELGVGPQQTIIYCFIYLKGLTVKHKVFSILAEVKCPQKTNELECNSIF